MRISKLFAIAFVLILVLGSTVAAEEPLVSTVFFESDVRDAVSELVFQTGVNIIMDETVRGIITLDLDNVPLEKALTMLSLAGGFGFKKIDDYYFLGIVDPRNPSFQHLTETESIKLQYISQAEARDLLPSIYDGYLRSSSERDIISITATPDIIKQFRRDVAAIDQRTQQVLIRAIVTEISHDILEEYGINLLDFDRRGSEGDDGSWRGLRLSSEDGSLADSFSFRTRFLDYGDLLAQLKLLESENKAEIKANPRVMVSDRRTVNLFSGTTQHMVVQGTGTTATLQAIDVGISLRVTPRVVNGEELEIIVAPEVSHFVSDRQNGRGTLVIRRNEVSTTVYVKDGQTLMIAGLTLEQETSYRSKVPVLGSIPILRWLFSNTSERLEERELIVFLVAEIQ